jgi:hypothetical protein
LTRRSDKPNLTRDHMGSLAVNKDPKPNPRYPGPERRKPTNRRWCMQRREEIRFEPGTEDRRSGKDRRKQTGWGDT